MASDEVRDLLWTLRSPGLLSPEIEQVVPESWAETVFRQNQDFFSSLERDPTSLLTHLSRNTRGGRLGIYFENLVAFLLQYAAKVENLKIGIPVLENKITVGEYDFLFSEPEHNQKMHWEAAVKFYLAYGERFIGPGGQDRLDLKLRKIFDQQLRLPERAGLKDVVSKVFLKGRLFYPLKPDWASARETASPALSKTHLRGWWIRQNELETLSYETLALLPKPRWLSGYNEQDARDRQMSRSKFLELCNDHFRKSHDSVAVLAQDFSRGFIVSNQWPHI